MKTILAVSDRKQLKGRIEAKNQKALLNLCHSLLSIVSVPAGFLGLGKAWVSTFSFIELPLFTGRGVSSFAAAVIVFTSRI